MKIQIKNLSYQKAVCDILLLGVFEDKKNPLEKLLSRKDEFEAKKGDVLVVSTQGKLPASKISFLGLGKSKDVTCETVRNAAAKGIKQAISSKPYPKGLFWAVINLRATIKRKNLILSPPTPQQF